MEWQTIVALILLVGFLITVVTTVVKFTDRLTKAEGALGASARAESKADRAIARLAEFEVEATGKFATASMVAQVERGVIDAINRLGDRIDRILEARGQ